MAAPGRALDLACGVGYGARLIADRAATSEVLGVDLSPQAVDYARERYRGAAAALQAADALAFEDAGASTRSCRSRRVEHVADPAACC